MNGKRGDFISSIDLDFGMLILPRLDFTSIESPSVVFDVTFTLLSIAHSMALIPKTTKCSPNRIILPGAEAIDFK